MPGWRKLLPTKIIFLEILALENLIALGIDMHPNIGRIMPFLQGYLLKASAGHLHTIYSTDSESADVKIRKSARI